MAPKAATTKHIESETPRAVFLCCSSLSQWLTKQNGNGIPGASCRLHDWLLHGGVVTFTQCTVCGIGEAWKQCLALCVLQLCDFRLSLFSKILARERDLTQLNGISFKPISFIAVIFIKIGNLMRHFLKRKLKLQGNYMKQNQNGIIQMYMTFECGDV